MKIVDHDERRREILHKALNLFARIGYEQVTYQQLAEACGLSRTALYKYFQNKKDVFDAALYHLVQNIGNDLRNKLEETPGMSAVEKLEMVTRMGIDLCMSNPELLQTVIEYLIAQKRQSEPVERKIRRHTVAFRSAINELVQEGIAAGEFKKVSPAMLSDLLFGLLQAAAIRIMFNDKPDREQLYIHCKLIIDSIKK